MTEAATTKTTKSSSKKGRTPLPFKTHAVLVRMNTEHWEKLSKMAAKDERTVSYLTRKAIAAFVEKNG